MIKVNRLMRTKIVPRSTNSLTLGQEEENLAENRRLESRSSAMIIVLVRISSRKYGSPIYFQPVKDDIHDPKRASGVFDTW